MGTIQELPGWGGGFIERLFLSGSEGLVVFFVGGSSVLFPLRSFFEKELPSTPHFPCTFFNKNMLAGSRAIFFSKRFIDKGCKLHRRGFFIDRQGSPGWL